MKSRLNLFSIFLSMMIFLFSILECNITVYASGGSHGGGGASSDTRLDRKEWFEENENEDLREDKVVMVMGCLLSEAKCLSDGDFSSFMSNYFSMKDYMTSSHITVSEDIDDKGTPGLVFDADLTSALKQALIEYAEDVNGFRLYPTIDYDLVPASEFKNAYDYKTFRNLVSESGCIIYNTSCLGSRSGRVLVGRPFHDITADSISLVPDTRYSNGLMVEASFYGTNTWTLYRVPIREFKTQYTDSNGYSAFRTFTSWDEGETITSNIWSGLLDSRGLYPTGSVCSMTFFSVDGRKLKVFNSLNALKNYTTGNRSVYFGSGFYDTPGEVKVSFDDLEKYIDGKYDDFFKDLKDLIGKETDNEDSMSEEDLEKLVDKILGSMNDNGNNDNPGDNTGDNSGILSELLSSLSSYFDSVLAYLDSILTSIQGLIYVETVKPDPDDGYDLSDMINDVWEDPQNGSQTVADSLSASFSDIGSALMAKFPFCIPNDLYSLFNVFANIPESRAAPMSLEEDGIQTYAESGSAPRFELPLVIESFGVDEVIIIDMESFTPLSKNARVFLSLIFAVALMKFSAVVIGFINDAWG